MSNVNFKVKEIGGLVLFTPRDKDTKSWWTNNVPVGSYLTTRIPYNPAFRKIYGDAKAASFVVPIKHAHKIWSDICTSNGNRGWSVA
jgi:hypothetical protein